ncbi:MAG: hypothetical protein QOF91_3784, partial [Alphaproteobacteria bacterium]|nr:hypothetical protein [Alphaproteobacteria bacterium]
TLLPWLMAARSRPLGANSLTTSDETPLTGMPFLNLELTEWRCYQHFRGGVCSRLWHAVGWRA